VLFVFPSFIAKLREMHQDLVALPMQGKNRRTAGAP
jgi:hypothetical protein